MKRAFTIVEVLVVIGIIAILTAIVLPSINNIRKKNRDTERISDITAIELGLSLYYNQHPAEGYPLTITGNSEFSPKYVPADSLVDPEGEPYLYVALTKSATTQDPKCTSYHLGGMLELSNAQIDPVDHFNSTNQGSEDMNYYRYCDDEFNSNDAIDGSELLMYHVHP